MSEEDIDAKLAEIEGKLDQTLENDQDTPASIEAEAVVDAKPPGFLNYDEWVAKGKDPADFRGENAYSKQYEALKEVRELKDTMGHVVEGMEDWKSKQQLVMNQQIEQSKVDAMAELDKAKEAEDMNAALAAQEKINRLDQQVTETKPAPNPILSDFAKKNPIMDTSSAQFDKEFAQTVNMMHNSTLDQILGGDRSRQNELTHDQIARAQTLAFNKAKEMYPDKFVSPRNKRTTTPVPKQRATNTTGSARSRLKDMKIPGKNAQDTNAADDMYEYLMEKDPTGKAAEKFANNMLGDK